MFGVALAFGVAAILFGYWFQDPFITIGLPALAIVVYWRLGLRGEKRGISNEKFADTVYYLGFLFTLVALAVTLYTFSQSSGDQSQIVSQFGLALITTVVGLAIRVSLVNFQPSVEDVGDAAEGTLVTAAETFERTLNAISLQMRTQQNVMEATTRIAVETTTEALEAAVTATRESLTSATGTLSTGVNEASEKLKDTLRKAGEEGAQEIGTVLRKLSGDTATLAVELAAKREALMHQIDETILPADVLVNNLVPAVDSLKVQLDRQASLMQAAVDAQTDLPQRVQECVSAVRSAATLSAELIATLQGLDVATLPLDEIKTKLSGAVAALTEFNAMLIRNTQRLDHQNAGITEVTERLDHQAAGIVQVNEQLSEELVLVRQHQVALAQEYAEAQQAVELMRQQLTEVVQFLHDQV
jgi:hypothetical protein